MRVKDIEDMIADMDPSDEVEFLVMGPVHRELKFVDSEEDKEKLVIYLEE